jgi:hypothetical protein
MMGGIVGEFGSQSKLPKDLQEHPYVKVLMEREKTKTSFTWVIVMNIKKDYVDVSFHDFAATQQCLKCGVPFVNVCLFRFDCVCVPFLVRWR